ncbi:hypothetical protein LBMAG42_12750 [Deltaproteobacteria bacterium]|nr:hypothetical protein LBMAG42_12750 [Deltaproteobacteria bacterium]
MKLHTDAALAAAVLGGAVCLALSGVLGLAAALLVTIGLWGGRRLRVLDDWTFLHILVICVCGALAFVWGVIPAFSLLLGWLTAHRAVVAEERTDHRILLLLATLMALIGSVGTLSLAMAPALLLFALAAPVALLRVAGITDRPLSIGAAGGTATLALGFFLLVPRLQGGLMAGAGEAVASERFADRVALGDELDDPDRDALVMRVRAWSRDGTPIHRPLYLRGRTLDAFDGRAWTSSGRVGRGAVGAWEERAEIMLEPMEGTTLFGPPDLLYGRSDQGPILQGGEGELTHTQPGRRIQYEVFSRSRGWDLIEQEVPALLQLPTLDPRIAALAATLAPGSDDPQQIIRAALRFFGEGFTYQIDPIAPAGDPLAWFLFDSRTGHCEYFASALAVLLRERGVPARLATGFYSAEENAAAGYISVRRGHAHAWVEVPVRGGWATVDSTPVGGLPNLEVSWWQSTAETANDAWLSLVLDYDLERQFDAAASLGSHVVAPVPGDPIRERGRAGIAGAGLVLAALMASGTLVRLALWWLARPKGAGVGEDALLRRFAKARARAMARGWDIPEELPPVEAGDWLVAHAGAAGEPLRELAWLLYRQRYGNVAAPPNEVERLCKAAANVPKPVA